MPRSTRSATPRPPRTGSTAPRRPPRGARVEGRIEADLVVDRRRLHRALDGVARRSSATPAAPSSCSRPNASRTARPAATAGSSRARSPTGSRTARRSGPTRWARCRRRATATSPSSIATIEAAGIDCDLRRSGKTTLAVEEWQLAGLREAQELGARHGVELELQSRDEVQGRRALADLPRRAPRPHRHGARRPGAARVGHGRRARASRGARLRGIRRHRTRAQRRRRAGDARRTATSTRATS